MLIQALMANAALASEKNNLYTVHILLTITGMVQQQEKIGGSQQNYGPSLWKSPVNALPVTKNHNQENTGINN